MCASVNVWGVWCISGYMCVCVVWVCISECVGCGVSVNMCGGRYISGCGVHIVGGVCISGYVRCVSA